MIQILVHSNTIWILDTSPLQREKIYFTFLSPYYKDWGDIISFFHLYLIMNHVDMSFMKRNILRIYLHIFHAMPIYDR